MSDRDKDQEEPLELSGLEPGEDEFEETPEEGFEGEGEPGESDEDEGRPEAVPSSRRRFGFGRGGQVAEESEHKGPTGSVRETHERVHVDDRASAIYALLAAAVLLGILALALAGNYVPKPAEASAPPLVVPTFNGTLPPSAAPSVSVAPSATPTPTPTPVVTPTPAPSAT
jgi:hypothetical protein